MTARLTPDQHRTVTEAVREAELGTSGEIVTVLAERSDPYSDVALWWALAASFVGMSLFAALPRPFLDLWDRIVVEAMLGGWGHEWTTGELASATIGLGSAVFLIALALLSRDAVRFACIPGRLKTARVHAAAVRHFKVGAERRTHGRTGVLIYLSMREHRAEILADATIAAKVDAEVWGEAMGEMLAEIRQGRLAEGLAVGVRDVGFVLAQHFPRGQDDTNELPDRLIEV